VYTQSVNVEGGDKDSEVPLFIAKAERNTQQERQFKYNLI
jgi:hypothetical protein